MTVSKEEEEQIITKQEEITSIRPDGFSVTSTVNHYSDGTAQIESDSQKADGSTLTTITQMASSQVESYISDLHGTTIPGENHGSQEAAPQPVSTGMKTTNNVADVEKGNFVDTPNQDVEKEEIEASCVRVLLLCLVMLCYLVFLLALLVVSCIVLVSGGVGGVIGLILFFIALMAFSLITGPFGCTGSFLHCLMVLDCLRRNKLYEYCTRRRSSSSDESSFMSKV